MNLTAEEWAELKAYDAAVDAEDVKMTLEEYKLSVKMDAKARGMTRCQYIGTFTPEERDAHHRRQRAAWYQSNREHCDAKKRESLARVHAMYGRFGVMLKEARISAGMSRKSLAEALGCSATNVGRYERGEITFDWEPLRAALPSLGPAPDDFPKRRIKR